jgi:hypothetical protein
MKRPSIILIVATLLAAALGSVSQANAKPYVANGFVVDGDARYEILGSSSGTCAADKFLVGTNDGLQQVAMLKELPKVEGFVGYGLVNWKCGSNGGYSHTQCPSTVDHLWVSRKLGTFFLVFCLGAPVGVSH